MSRSAAFLLLIAAPMISVLIGFGIDDQFRRIQAASQAARANQAAEWAREDVTRKVLENEKFNRRKKEQAHHLEEALGSAAEAAWKNPDLSITQMLEQRARACAPAGTRVTVNVNQFTEFSVSLTLTKSLPNSRLADIGFCLLQHSLPYLRNVVFFADGAVVGEVDGRMIDSVTDWKIAGAKDFENLLNDVIREDQPVAQNISRDKAPADREERKLDPVSQRFRDAQSKFNQLLDQQNKILKSVLARQDQGSSMGDVRGATDMDQKLALLRAGETELGSARIFLLNQDREYERVLREAEVDPLLAKIEARGAIEKQVERRQYLEQLFQALGERQKSAMSLATEMQRKWGTWRPQGTMIEFTSVETKNAYTAAGEQWRQASDQVNAAFRALAEWERGH
jgi:hypothetical protein